MADCRNSVDNAVKPAEYDAKVVSVANALIEQWWESASSVNSTYIEVFDALYGEFLRNQDVGLAHEVKNGRL